MTLAVPAQAAAPTSEDTIAAIGAEEEAAVSWMASRTSTYGAFLASDPTLSEATAERDRAILAIYARAFQTQLKIYQLMANHPGDSEVAGAGQEAIAAAYETAAEESQMTRELYDEFVAALADATTTTTTTTLAPAVLPPPTTSTTLPGQSTTSTTSPNSTTTSTAPTTQDPPTTSGSSTSTTLPGRSTASTTSSSSTTTSAAPTTQSAPTTPGSSTSTTLAAEPGDFDSLAAATMSPPPPIGVSPGETGTGSASTQETRVRMSTSTLAIRLIGEQVPTGWELAHPDGGSRGGEQELGFRLAGGLIRLSLPAAITLPLVDVALLLRAVVAAFWSGIATLAWPAGTLTGSLLLYGIWRRIRRI